MAVGSEPAAAGTVSFDWQNSPGPPTILYEADPGERNDVSISVARSSVAPYPQTAMVSDTAGVRPGPGCVAVDQRVASCEVTRMASLWAFEARLGDGDDKAAGTEVGSHGARFLGGAGDDELRGLPLAMTVLVGGAGDDEMFGGGQAIFDEGTRANGSDLIDGGIGSDAATGVLWVDYSGRRRSVSLDLGGRRDDGERKERDTIVGVDVLVGGSAADRLGGGPGAESLLGGPGRDVLAGGPGPDYLDAEWPLRAMPASSRRTHDVLSGGGGEDDLVGGPGGNLLIGGPGADGITGGAGDDRVRARDGALDQVGCRGGRDRLSQDRLDFHRGCERQAPQSRAAVPIRADAETGKFGDRYVTVELGCPGRRFVRCSGTVALEADDGGRGSAAFDGEHGTASVTFTPESDGFLTTPFDPLWERFRAHDPGVFVAVTTNRVGGPAIRVPASLLRKSYRGYAYLPDAVVDHVATRRPR
ncbi:MAG TPA: calcium-binding protein [Thermoleophilaceae bacterium]|nr:calcium-binding protein [Thermoleophilaceae bacterium]